MAFLFWVKYFVVTGKTKPSQPSYLCKCNVPSGAKVDLTPMPAHEMIFKNQHYAGVNERDLQKGKKSYMKFFMTFHLVKSISEQNMGFITLLI